jgi:hypothetical protein
VAKLSVFDAFPDETLLDSARQRAYFGGVSEMFLHRREQASRRERERRKRDGLPIEPGPDEAPLYPLPRYIGQRKYQRLGDLRRYSGLRYPVPNRRNAGRPLAAGRCTGRLCSKWLASHSSSLQLRPRRKALCPPPERAKAGSRQPIGHVT